MTAITGGGVGGAGPSAQSAPARPAPVAPSASPASSAPKAPAGLPPSASTVTPPDQSAHTSEALQAAQAALQARSQEQQKAVQARAQENLKEMQRRLDEAIERLNEQMQQNQTKLGFVVDSATDRLIVKVMNKETGEVVRQIPGEALVKIAQSIESMKGMFFDQEL